MKNFSFELELNEQTKKALMEIGYGDRVRFKSDTPEGLTFKNEVYTVTSKNPLVKHTRYGTIITVYLQNLGWFPITKLEAMAKPVSFPIEQVRKGWACCYENGVIPDCPNCPYKEYSFTLCRKLLTMEARKFSDKAEKLEEANNDHN